MLAAMFVVLAVATQQTWIVNAQGGGQFTTIQAAIDAAASGDTIVVEPGRYPPFTLTKDLSILGDGQASEVQVTGRSVVAAAPAFRLSHLDLAGLDVDGVPGLGVLEDSHVHPHHLPIAPPALDVGNCAQLLVERCDIVGAHGFPNGGTGGDALGLASSNVVVADCSLRGGTASDGSTVNRNGGNGGAGIRATKCTLGIAGCAVVIGGTDGVDFGFTSASGVTGDGILLSKCTATLRGAGTDLVAAGSPALGGNPIGNAIDALDASKVVVSGVIVGQGGTHQSTTSQLTLLAAAEPCLAFEGGGALGEHVALDLTGPDGAAALLAVGASHAALGVGGYSGALWLDPSQALVAAVVTSGPQPVQLLGTVPADPALLGTPFLAQAAFPGIPGSFQPDKTKFLSDPAVLLVGP